MHPDPVFVAAVDTSVVVAAVDTSVVVAAAVDTSVAAATDTSVATVALAFDSSLVEVEKDHNQDLALDQVVLAGTVLDTADSFLVVLVALHLEATMVLKVMMVPEVKMVLEAMMVLEGILNSSSEVELPIV